MALIPHPLLKMADRSSCSAAVSGRNISAVKCAQSAHFTTKTLPGTAKQLLPLFVLILVLGNLVSAAGWYGLGEQMSPVPIQQTEYWVYLPSISHPEPDCPPEDQVAFTSTELQRPEVGIVCRDGSGRRLITNTPGFQSSSPSWSPDRTRLVFTSDRDGTSRMYLYDLSCQCEVGKIPMDLEAYEPIWSPAKTDDQRIAFVSQDGIYAVNLDGSNLTRITEPGEGAWNGTWSPDGTHIAYTVWDGARRAIRIREVGGTGYTQLLTPGSDYGPAWSPDGTQIVFASAQGELIDLYLIQVDGSGLIQLTNLPEHETQPSWSPDGSQIVFVGGFQENVNLFIMYKDGSGLQSLIPQGHDPAWGN